ncbi:MAG TPA: HEAT repeat domain-containing protein [Polyangiaceae bacterium]|nr:HEAT repeat domain-containing protein [Polyangiaceae bacterium]
MIAGRVASLSLVLASLVAGCGRDEAKTERVAERPATLPSDVTRALRDVARAAAARRVQAIPETALAHHDPRVRRAATRALSLLADPAATTLLERRLHDEDPEVVAWALHGLGLLSPGRESETVLAVASRLGSLSIAEAEPLPRLEPSLADAAAFALGRAGTAAAEETLRALLAPGSAPRAAARALARLSSRSRRLDDRTTVALLEAAARNPPVDEALAPFAYLEAPSATVATRLLDVARAAVGRGGPARTIALRALAGAGAPAVPVVAAVLTDEKASTPDRAVAAKTLGKLGDPGQDALATAIGTLAVGAKTGDERTFLAAFAPLAAALGAMTPPLRVGQDALVALTELDPARSKNPAVQRRIVALRCGAAVALAGTASRSSRLVSCDPDPKGRAGALAALEVLDRGDLTRARFETWTAFTESADVAVRRRALSLVARHPEMPSVTPLLERALSAKEPGIVVEAARALAAVPRQASGKGPPDADAPPQANEPVPSIVEALGKALDAERPPDQIEPRLALARAAATLSVLSLKPRVEALCRDERDAIRRGAEAALRAFGTPTATCPPPPTPKLAEPVTAPSEPVSVTFVTDAGRLGLTLDPKLAPLAVLRLAELSRAGFFDHQTIGRTVPGFVVQLGDPVGDGYSGSGRPPVPTETAPARAGAFTVGLALSGRDTGSSQFFVTLSDDPSIDQDYPLVGYADPDWSNAAEGDVIEKVEIGAGGSGTQRP